MSREAKLNAFNAKHAHKLFKEFLWEILDEAQLEVCIDLKTPIEEQSISISADDRAVNLPDDFLIGKSFRYKDSSSDAEAEGFPITIVDEMDLL
jgi:hypothetical protein